MVLAVGTRLQPQQMNWGMDDELKIIRIDIDSEELDRQKKPEIGIIGDAAATLKALANRLGAHNAKRNGRAEAGRRDQGRSHQEDPRHAGTADRLSRGDPRGAARRRHPGR